MHVVGLCVCVYDEVSVSLYLCKCSELLRDGAPQIIYSYYYKELFFYTPPSIPVSSASHVSDGIGQVDKLGETVYQVNGHKGILKQSEMIHKLNKKMACS